MVQKILINTCYGGFGLSDEFKKVFKERYNTDISFDIWLPRNDETIIALVEEFGCKKSSGKFASLKIIEIPDDCKEWYIDEYDGKEKIIEDCNCRHRVWRYEECERIKK